MNSPNVSAEPEDAPHSRALWMRPFRRPLITCAVLYFIYNLKSIHIRANEFDEWNQVYVLAAQQLRTGGDIYQLLVQQKHHPFTYPPFAAVFAIPFTFLSQTGSLIVWYLINVVSLSLLWIWAWRASGGEKLNVDRPNWRELLICGLGYICAMRFVQGCLGHRQTDLFIGMLLVGGCIAWQKRQDITATLLWALAASLKGPPMLMLGYLIWRRRPFHALAMLLVVLGLNLLPDLVHPAAHGLWLTQWYAEVLKPMRHAGAWYSDIVMNQSLAGLFRRYLGTTWRLSPDGLRVALSQNISPHAIDLALLSCEVLLMLVAAIGFGAPFKREPASDRPQNDSTAKLEFRLALEVSVMLVLILLFSPMSSKPHFCTLILPGFCVARLAVRDRKLSAQIFLGVCLLVIGLLDRLPGSLEDLPSWFGNVTWGSIALMAACLIALRCRCATSSTV